MANQLFLERDTQVPAEGAPGEMTDEEYLKLFKKYKTEAFDSRWIWERGWMRNIHYVNNRQWIEYVRRTNEWRDVKLANWYPKPVTNKMSEGVQTLRAMFTSVNVGVDVRPVGSDPVNISVSATASEMASPLHEIHAMDEVLNEADYWFIVTGNVFLHTFLERDIKHGITEIPIDKCLDCGIESLVNETTPEVEDENALPPTPTCPQCGSTNIQPATDELGAPKVHQAPNGRGVTTALSPFELAFPNSYARFSDVPYVIRLRWRSKEYYENHPTLKSQVKNVKWSKAPAEQALQLFRSLPHHSDIGVAPFLGSSGGSGDSDEFGSAEYELWVRPCDQFPEGLVLRVLGDSNPIVLHLEQDEAIPGPLPYRDVDGKPIFTFAHAAFEQRGGRVYGTSPLDGAIQKQNLLNQLDSFVLMIINRTANPLWLVPKGAGIQKFTGAPGLVVEWNPLTVGGTAKPERIDGTGPPASLFAVRDQHLKDIEEALGTFDVLKGSKPAGVEAFSALQLLVEKGQSRFASAFKARGHLYKEWFKFALEIEREFGPEERIQNVMSPARTWTQKQFLNSQLQGAFEVIVEDGSMTPKTTLGMRASVEHLNSLGALDFNDPDQKYEVFRLFGQTRLSPALDRHMQSALRKQQAFEDWAKDPAAQQEALLQAEQAVGEWEQQVAQIQDTPPQLDPATGMDTAAPTPIPPPPSPNKFTPLAWKGWYDPAIHKQEFLKWANSDVMFQLLAENPALEQLLEAHLLEIDNALMQAAMLQNPPAPNPGGGGIGAGQAMKNSNKESGGSQNEGNPTGKQK